MPSYQATSPTALAGERPTSTTGSSWNPENDELLKRARQQGLNWQPIATKYFPDKTANACRKRHERLMEKSNAAGNWDTAKMDRLAMAYNDVREQMWRILAERVDERWQTVEAKCMEKGLKTLQTAGRTASRRERTSVNHFDDYPDPFLRDHLSRSRSPSHDNISDCVNDSAIGLDTDPPFTARAGADDQQVPHSAGGLTSVSSRSFTPNRTFSNHSVAPQLPMVQSPTPLQQPTLPSFSATFGLGSISGPLHSPPVTTH